MTSHKYIRTLPSARRNHKQEAAFYAVGVVDKDVEQGRLRDKLCAEIKAKMAARKESKK